jgi:hypothetical protein
MPLFVVGGGGMTDTVQKVYNHVIIYLDDDDARWRFIILGAHHVDYVDNVWQYLNELEIVEWFDASTLSYRLGVFSVWSLKLAVVCMPTIKWSDAPRAFSFVVCFGLLDVVLVVKIQSM